MVVLARVDFVNLQHPVATWIGQRLRLTNHLPKTIKELNRNVAARFGQATENWFS